MKLTELLNLNTKSFEFAAFKWLVKRFGNGSRRLIIGTLGDTYAITLDGVLVEQAPDIITLCQRVQQRGLK